MMMLVRGVVDGVIFMAGVVSAMAAESLETVLLAAILAYLAHTEIRRQLDAERDDDA